MSFNSFQVGPNSTPKTIKAIIGLTILFSILISVVPKDYLFHLLGLSSQGIKDGLYFQLFTNLFIIPNNVISFGFVFHLLFNCYLIWVFGSSVVEWKGLKHFIALLIICGIPSSFVALYVMGFGSVFTFAGSTILVYAFSMAWLMLHSDAKILLFFTLPFKAKWLVLGAMALNLLSLLSQENYVYLLSYLSSSVLAYLYSLIVWQKQSPFNFLKKMEKAVISLLQKGKIGKRKDNSFHQSKIYDFSTGEPIIDDDEFMDAMLSRIALYGEDILTKEERNRMDEIALKKKPK